MVVGGVVLDDNCISLGISDRSNYVTRRGAFERVAVAREGRVRVRVRMRVRVRGRGRVRKQRGEREG